MRVVDSLYGGPGHSVEAVEVHRRTSGRLAFAITRDPDGSWWLHVQPAPGLTSMSRQFRESHALRAMGFEPVGRCRFWPVACVFGGCYARSLAAPSDGDLGEAAAAQIGRRLEPSVDALLDIALELARIGIDMRTPERP